MFEKILVPLDGSEAAEKAIPYASMLAAKLGSELFLLHANSPDHEAFHHMYEIYLEHMADTAREQVRKEWQETEEPHVSSEILLGKTVDVICDFVKKKAIKMTVMTSCGASGVRPWTLGSVVNQVIRAVTIPSLLLRVRDGQPVVGKKKFNRILLPMDGSEASEIALPYGVELASKLGASIVLFRMSQTVYAQGLDGLSAGVGVNWDEIDATTEKYVHGYLEDKEKEVKQAGVDVTHVVKIGLDPASEILEQEKKSKADLVVMATRGRSPIARWAFGSVAEKVLREGGLPLLVIREAIAH